jgi:ribosomal-protein-alanine N-acetyltransferase
VIAAAPRRFRAMAPADLDRVMVINHASFRHPWSADLMRREMLHDWSTVLLAVDGSPGVEEVQGFIVYWTVQDEMHVLNVAVAPEHRRRGVARALMREAEARGRRRGIRLVTLEVRRSNEAAIALYRKLGYRMVGVRPNYYAEEGEDAMVMERQVGP